MGKNIVLGGVIMLTAFICIVVFFIWLGACLKFFAIAFDVLLGATFGILTFFLNLIGIVFGLVKKA